MENTADKDQNLKRDLVLERIYEWITKNATLFLGMFPIVGVGASSIIQFLIYIYGTGRASAFSIPKEYVIINFNVTIYNTIIGSGFGILYIFLSILTVRSVLRQESKWKQIVRAIAIGIIIPTIALAGIFLIFFIQSDQIFSFIMKEWKELLKYSFFTVLFLHPCLVIAFGYLFPYPIHKDLLKEKENKKNQIQKENKKTKWAVRDWRILGVGLIWGCFIISGGISYHRGSESVEMQKEFQITTIDNTKYVVAMTDGEEAVIEKCVLENDTLIVYGTEYMKVECKNLLLETEYFSNGISAQ